METDNLYPSRMYADLSDHMKVIVRGVAKEKFLAMFFLKRSDVKNVQLKDDFKM
jgi:hypothetical protein